MLPCVGIVATTLQWFHACTRSVFPAATAGRRFTADTRRRCAVADCCGRLEPACGQPAAVVARVFLGTASHALRGARNGLDTALPDGVGPGEADWRNAALREDTQLRRVRVRLGLGRCVPALRTSLLSECLLYTSDAADER